MSGRLRLDLAALKQVIAEWPPHRLPALSLRLAWKRKARKDQIAPAGNWRVWFVMAGRGWGKTLTGAVDMATYALDNPKSRLAVIAPTHADARNVCVEGESGLLGVLPHSFVRRWRRSAGDLILKNGSLIRCFSADRPDRLRGPQHHRVWCDELGAWPNRHAFDQLWFGLRLGRDPRVVVTTTPRNTEVIRELVAKAGGDVHLTHGRTMDNVEHLAPQVLKQLKDRYEGTRLGRQELDAELLDDTFGALWKREVIDANRAPCAPNLSRVVVAIDPAMSSGENSDETGIIAAGLGVDGLIYVLSDWSCRASPDGWAQRAILLYEDLSANMIIAEINAGGEMVERILRQKSPHVVFKAVHALRHKAERALPVAALYEQGRVRHVGTFGRLENQMCRFTPSGFDEGSPDRVDALVWAVTELSDTRRGEPRVKTL